MVYLSKFDSTLLIVGIGSLVSFYGLLLFGIEWYRKQDASFIFKSVTFLFLGEFIDDSVGFYGRWISIFDPATQFQNFRDTYLWSSKYVITILVMFGIVVYMTLRKKKSKESVEEAIRLAEEQATTARKLVVTGNLAAHKLLYVENNIAYVL